MHGGRGSNSRAGRTSQSSGGSQAASLAESLELLAEVSDDVFWVMDAQAGAITYVSSAYERVWKRSRPSLIGSPCEWHGWILGEDRASAYQGLDALLKQGRALDIKYRIVDGEGHERWAHDRAWPIRGETGDIRSIIGIVRDISNEKVAEEHQKLLMREMNHRVKNTLATVLSIAHQTAAFTATLESFLEAFYARIHAFSGAHDLLMQNAWTSVRLDEVISRTLAHHMQNGSDRIQIDGPTVLLPHDPSVALNLVFHELATNAAKYGALSNATGRVSVIWSVETSGNSGVLDLRWEETGGPPVEAEQKRGFGSRLIKRTLAALGGKAEVNYAPSGFDCWIALPLAFDTKLPEQG